MNGIRLSGGIGLAVAADGSIYRSTDDGATWSQMASPVQGRAILYSVHMLGPSLAFASGSAGTLLRYGSAAEAAGAGISAPDVLLMQNAPNPVRNGCRIEYTLSSGGPVALRLFNVSGHLVRTLVQADQPAGKHTVEFSETGLRRGIYFYRIETGGGVETRKMLIE